MNESGSESNGVELTQDNLTAKQFVSIMDLTGDKKVRISDDGAAEITVDSGLAVYQYLLPAQSK